MTLEYYQRHAQDFFSATVNVDMASLYAPFLERIPAGGRILDAGCGSGRDSKAFQQRGYAVEAFDATAEMVALATQHTGLPVRQMTFSDVDVTARYDGIWCCASLLHVRMQALPEAMEKLAQALKPGGVWYVSFKYGDGERIKEGRHFTDLNEHALKALLTPLTDITLIRHWITEDKRPERTEMWLNALLVKSPLTAKRPLPTCSTLSVQHHTKENHDVHYKKLRRQKCRSGTGSLGIRCR